MLRWSWCWPGTQSLKARSCSESTTNMFVCVCRNKQGALARLDSVVSVSHALFVLMMATPPLNYSYRHGPVVCNHIHIEPEVCQAAFHWQEFAKAMADDSLHWVFVGALIEGDEGKQKKWDLRRKSREGRFQKFPEIRQSARDIARWISGNSGLLRGVLQTTMRTASVLAICWSMVYDSHDQLHISCMILGTSLALTGDDSSLQSIARKQKKPERLEVRLQIVLWESAVAACKYL